MPDETTIRRARIRAPRREHAQERRDDRRRRSGAILHRFFVHTAQTITQEDELIAEQVANEERILLRLAGSLGLSLEQVPPAPKRDLHDAWENVARAASLHLLDTLAQLAHGEPATVSIDDWISLGLEAVTVDAGQDLTRRSGLDIDSWSKYFRAVARAALAFPEFTQGTQLQYASGDLLLRALPAQSSISAYHTSRPVLGVVTMSEPRPSSEPDTWPLRPIELPGSRTHIVTFAGSIEFDGQAGRDPRTHQNVTFSSAVEIVPSEGVEPVRLPHGYILEGEVSGQDLVATIRGEEDAIHVRVDEHEPSEDKAVGRLFAG